MLTVFRMVSASHALLFSVFLFAVVTYETKANNALYGEECLVDKNCISAQMVCGSGTCKCFRGQYASEDRSNCIATTAGLCFDDSDCRSLQSSSCFLVESDEGICKCNDGYTSSEDTMRCLPDSTYQGSCEELTQCTKQLSNFAVCKEGICDCQTKYHYSVQDGRCIMDVDLLGGCVNTSQCVTSGPQNSVLCDKGVCSCASGYRQVQDTCTDGAQNLIVSGTALLLYWIIKVVIT